MTFAARSGNQWDGTQKFRREMQVLDERNRVARKISWSDVNSPVEDSIIMDDGCKLLMLPSGCWVCLPEKLDKVSLDKVEKAEPDQSGGSKGDPVEAVKKALEAAFSTESDKVSLLFCNCVAFLMMCRMETSCQACKASALNLVASSMTRSFPMVIPANSERRTGACTHDSYVQQGWKNGQHHDVKRVSIVSLFDSQ